MSGSEVRALAGFLFLNKWPKSQVKESIWGNDPSKIPTATAVVEPYPDINSQLRQEQTAPKEFGDECAGMGMGIALFVLILAGCTDTQMHGRTVMNIFFRLLYSRGMFLGVFVVHTGNKCAGAQVCTRATSHFWACRSPHNYLRLTSMASFPPRGVSKLSRHNLHRSIMPPKVATPCPPPPPPPSFPKATTAIGVQGGQILESSCTTISAPSILEVLHNVLLKDGVTVVVCVPYFLSLGRHAMEDVPNLIA